MTNVNRLVRLYKLNLSEEKELKRYATGGPLPTNTSQRLRNAIRAFQVKEIKRLEARVK